MKALSLTTLIFCSLAAISPAQENPNRLESIDLKAAKPQAAKSQAANPKPPTQPDISTVKPDLSVPEIHEADPKPGIRARQKHPDYADTQVSHILYLPTDWKPGRSYPVIVEYAGNGPFKNSFGDISTGHVEGSNLGYGLSAGQGYIWLCLPYLNNDATENVTRWWGTAPTFDPKPTVEYAKKVVPWICKNYGGDPDKVILTGFSRGAIACNFIGLHDDEISRLWAAFIPYSHYDGAHEGWPYPGSDRASALIRLKRLGARPQFILHEGTAISGTKAYLESTGIDLTNIQFRGTGFRNHNDAWLLRPSPARTDLRTWLSKLPTRSGGVPGP
jgi:hypothetical protein